jgi:phage repressor protein C with HTH and peptisase S24 domain
MNDDLIEQLKAAKIPHAEIGKALGRAQPAATRLLNGQRSLKASEIPKLQALLKNWKNRLHPDLPAVLVEENGYVPVEVMPTYVGMGGGGTGEDDVETALVPRYLVEGVLRGHSEDFVLIRTRGDSMAPDFFHDDDVLCDRRDRSPTQPGPFALWHDDAYVLKNVERVADGRVRIFSSNPKYTTVEIPTDQTRIIGRPVWVGRRL